MRIFGNLAIVAALALFASAFSAHAARHTASVEAASLPLQTLSPSPTLCVNVCYNDGRSS